MACKKGGFRCIRHGEVMDLSASRLGEIYQDVTTEPAQLTLDREHLKKIQDGQHVTRDAAWCKCRGFRVCRQWHSGHPHIRPDGCPSP